MPDYWDPNSNDPNNDLYPDRDIGGEMQRLHDLYLNRAMDMKKLEFVKIPDDGSDVYDEF